MVGQSASLIGSPSNFNLFYCITFKTLLIPLGKKNSATKKFSQEKECCQKKCHKKNFGKNKILQKKILVKRKQFRKKKIAKKKVRILRDFKGFKGF